MAAAMLVSVASPISASTTNDNGDIIRIADRLAAVGNCSLEGTLGVAMPQLAEDVMYGVTLHQLAPVDGDTLAPAPYVIDWRREQTENDIHGFSAYFPGNHYRLQGDRLLEYHYSADRYPFGKEKGKGGVQNTAQFANLLPAFMARDLKSMADDQRYYIHAAEDTIVDGRKAVVVKAIMTVNGITANESEYVFDHSSMLPRRVTYENNPGAISEQTVTVVFGDKSPSTSSPESPLTEEQLISRYPDDFATKRLSSYRLDNLKGRRLPAFEAPTLKGDRYTYAAGQKFTGPTLIVVCEAQSMFTKEMIDQIRQGAAQLVNPADIIWAFVDKHTGAIEDAVGKSRSGETTLVGARALARDCGVTDMPSLIAVERDGTVKSASSGYNNHMASDVINMLTK